MKPRTAAFTLVLFIGACGEAGPGSSTTLSVEPTTTLAGDGVAVVVTATPVQQADASIELCPPGMTGACPGIVLQGEIDRELISSVDNPTVVQVTGRYDGRALYADSKPVAAEYPPIQQYEFDSLCPDLQGTPSVNPDETLTQAINDYALAQPDYAARWWDRESAVLTIWFKGDDVSRHETAIAAIAGEEPVCVAGGAQFSEAELTETSQGLVGFTDSQGLPLTTYGYNVGGLSNRIDLPLDAIDAPTEAALEDRFDGMVAPYPFIELVDVSLAELPEPILAMEGDVDILTSGTRWGGGMAALGLFPATKYDAELECVYLTDPDEDWRTVPVWPFGYSATSDPMTVYDYDGHPVVAEGEPIELAGGEVGLDGVEGNTCGADAAWIVNR